jgi:hypothetical protein
MYVYVCMYVGSMNQQSGSPSVVYLAEGLHLSSRVPMLHYPDLDSTPVECQQES